MARPLTVLIDTNVLLDVILGREPWVEEAAQLLDAVAAGAVAGAMAAHAVTTVYYVTEQAKGHAVAATAVSDLLELLPVVPLDSADFTRALTLGLRDFEDAVQVAAALRVGARILVTRNAKDFRGAPVEVRSPSDVLALLPRRRR